MLILQRFGRPGCEARFNLLTTFLPILDLIRETSPEKFSAALAILKEQNIHPTCDSIRFLLHQTNVLMVEPFDIEGGFEVLEPDLTIFDQFMEG